MISLADLQRRIEAGELSPDDAIAQSHAAIEAREKDVRAFVRHDKSAKAQGSGPLRGIAVGIKDIIDTANMPTEMGSEIYRGWQPRSDAPVVMMLKRAGATIIGKTTTTAFASRDPTPTLNPHNPGHTPGGSSSGSAAAVGAGMIPLALGTQTGGSVIRPAAYCGAAAIKPSFRMLPTIGVKCYSWALDTVGLFGSRAEDLARGLLGMTGRTEFDGIAPAKAPRKVLFVISRRNSRTTPAIPPRPGAARAAPGRGFRDRRTRARRPRAPPGQAGSPPARART